MSEVKKLCDNCRFWSEMIAQANGGAVEAACLSGAGPKASKYTFEWDSCVAWKSGHFGAVDSPPNYGEQQRELYAKEEAGRER